MYNEHIGVEAEEFLKDYYAIVYNEAKRFKGKAYYNDIVQEGMVGLMKAYNRYENGHGKKFSSYAFELVRGAMLHYYRDKTRLIRFPRTYSKIKNIIDDNNYSEKDIIEISKKVQCSEYHVRQVIRLIGSVHLHGDKDLPKQYVSNGEKDSFFGAIIGKEDDFSKIFVDEFLSKIDGRMLEAVNYSLIGLNRTETSKYMNISQPAVSIHLKKAQKKWYAYTRGEI